MIGNQKINKGKKFCRYLFIRKCEKVFKNNFACCYHSLNVFNIMSDTDDTDVLLLIPPDFFLVKSSEESSCVETARTVVPRAYQSRRSIEAINATIGSLEHRVKSLELTLTPRSKLSSVTSERTTPSIDKLYGGEKRSHTFPKRRRRKFISKKNRFNSFVNTTHSSSCCEEIPLLALTERVSDFVIEQNKISFTMDSEGSSVVSSSSKRNDNVMLTEIDEFLNTVDSYELQNVDFKRSNNNLSSKTDLCRPEKYENQSSITLPSGRRVPRDFLDKYIYLSKNNEIKPQHQTPEDFKLNGEKCSYKKPTSSARKLNFDERKEITSTPKTKLKVTLPSMPKQSDKLLEFASLSNCDTLSNISPSGSPVKDRFKFQKFSLDKEMEQNMSKNELTKFPHSVDTDLLSLSELWSDRDGCKVDNPKLEEERLKREHCEKVIQDLQRKVLELQEKNAVAVKVDRSKDKAIARLKEAWIRLTSDLEATETKHKNTVERLNGEILKLRQSAEDTQKKTRHFESELYKTLDLAHDYQDKCKQAHKDKQNAEADRDKIIVEKDAFIQKKEEEIESLRENYESVIRLNKQLSDCVKNAEENLEKEKISHEETHTQLSSANELTKSYQEELNLQQQERDLLKQKLKEEHSRISILEKQISQNKPLEQEVKNLRRHLELQKEELKSYYQKQLEEAVLAKLTEFQQQLDSAEKEMEREAMERESRMAEVQNERLVNVERQRKLEIQILEEKQKEEIKLYRLQLAQAGEKITLLESKVERYRQRRTDIASQLHAVMQSQWEQALSILTGQNDSARTLPGNPTPEPAQSKTSNRDLRTDERRFPDALSDSEMQHYVNMLLKKPADLNFSSDSEPIRCDLDEPTSDKSHDDKQHKLARRSTHKPPWKA